MNYKFIPLAAAVLLASCAQPAPADENPAYGMYEAQEIFYQDNQFDPTGEWIELGANERAVFYMQGDTVEAQYTLNGEEVTFHINDQVWTATLKDGTLSLNIQDIWFFYQKRGTEYPGHPAELDVTPAVEEPEPVAFDHGWYDVVMVNEGGESREGEGEGIEFLEDGTCSLYLSDPYLPINGYYEMTTEGLMVASRFGYYQGTVSDDEIVLSLTGDVELSYVLKKGEKPADKDAHLAETMKARYDGEYEGMVKVIESEGEACGKDWTDAAANAFAAIRVDDDLNVHMDITATYQEDADFAISSAEFDRTSWAIVCYGSFMGSNMMLYFYADGVHETIVEAMSYGNDENAAVHVVGYMVPLDGSFEGLETAEFTPEEAKSLTDVLAKLRGKTLAEKTAWFTANGQWARTLKLE